MKIDMMPRFEVSLARFLRLSMGGKADAPLLEDLKQIDTSGSDPLVVLVARAERGRNYTETADKYLDIKEIHQAFEFHSDGYKELLAKEAEVEKQRQKAAAAEAKLEAKREEKRQILREYHAKLGAAEAAAHAEANKLDPNQSAESLDSMSLDDIKKLVAEQETKKQEAAK